MKDLLVMIRGGGDIATGIAVRLFNAGFKVIIIEVENPKAVRLEVSFAKAVYSSTTIVENIEAIYVKSYKEIEYILKKRKIPVIIDSIGKSITEFKPNILIDGIMAKHNIGTNKNQAPLVVGIGPGFIAGVDVDVIIETKRGHYLGRAIYNGSAIPDTGIPGEVMGESKKRLLKSPMDGEIVEIKRIGDTVKKGDIIAMINNTPLKAEISGIIRGLIYPYTKVTKGMKIGDIDPRGVREYCFTVSDKARSVGGGVLEAICNFINYH